MSDQAETLTILLWEESLKWNQNLHGWITWFQRVHKPWKRGWEKRKCCTENCQTQVRNFFWMQSEIWNHWEPDLHFGFCFEPQKLKRIRFFWCCLKFSGPDWKVQHHTIICLSPATVCLALRAENRTFIGLGFQQHRILKTGRRNRGMATLWMTTLLPSSSYIKSDMLIRLGKNLFPSYKTVFSKREKYGNNVGSTYGNPPTFKLYITDSAVHIQIHFHVLKTDAVH